MNEEEAREISAQIWCKPGLSNRVMDPELCEEMACMIMRVCKEELEHERERAKGLVDCLKQIQRQYQSYSGDTDQDIEKAIAKYKGEK